MEVQGIMKTRNIAIIKYEFIKGNYQVIFLLYEVSKCQV